MGKGKVRLRLQLHFYHLCMHRGMGCQRAATHLWMHRGMGCQRAAICCSCNPLVADAQHIQPADPRPAVPPTVPPALQIGAQCAHAAVGAVERLHELRQTAALAYWERCGQPKVCLRASSTQVRVGGMVVQLGTAWWQWLEEHQAAAAAVCPLDRPSSNGRGRLTALHAMASLPLLHRVTWVNLPLICCRS